MLLVLGLQNLLNSLGNHLENYLLWKLIIIKRT